MPQTYEGNLEASGGLLNLIVNLEYYDNVWYVDANASGDADGSTMANGLTTIAAARTLAGAAIDWTQDAYLRNAILVAPELYAESLGGFYYCDLIGLGVRGTDGAAEIHPATLSPIDGDATLLNARFINLRFETNQALACVDAGIVNSTGFYGCTFTNGAAVAAWGIETVNSTHLTVEGCSFESGQTTGLTYGIKAMGGADKFLHNARIRHNQIFASTAGIYIEDICTASQAVIGPGNLIGPAACLKGIDDNNGTSYVFGNYITAVDAIEHANSASQCIGNYVINNGTGAVETTHA